MKIQSKYKITYSNGISQVKNLISQEDFENIIRPIQLLTNYLESNKKTEKQVKNIKGIPKELFGGEWFTNKSPIFDAIKTGVLDLPEVQGGKQKCKVKKIK